MEVSTYFEHLRNKQYLMGICKRVSIHNNLYLRSLKIKKSFRQQCSTGFLTKGRTEAFRLDLYSIKSGKSFAFWILSPIIK